MKHQGYLSLGLEVVNALQTGAWSLKEVAIYQAGKVKLEILLRYIMWNVGSSVFD